MTNSAEKKGIVYHWDMMQGTEEWRAARCGIITASRMKLLVTEKTLKTADNEKVRGLIYELAGERIQNMQPEEFQSYDMLRGQKEEVLAKGLYSKHYAPVKDCGFVTNDHLGFKIGISPDGLVGDDGSIEAKSRVSKYQVETIVLDVLPSEYRAQVEGNFLVMTDRKWCDFLSYSNGMHMLVKRAEPNADWQGALTDACIAAEAKIVAVVDDYKTKTEKLHRAPWVDVMAELSSIKSSSNAAHMDLSAAG